MTDEKVQTKDVVKDEEKKKTKVYTAFGQDINTIPGFTQGCKFGLGWIFTGALGYFLYTGRMVGFMGTQGLIIGFIVTVSGNVAYSINDQLKHEKEQAEKYQKGQAKLEEMLDLEGIDS